MNEERHRNHSLRTLLTSISLSKVLVNLIHQAQGQRRILLVENQNAMDIVLLVTYMAMDSLEKIGEVLSQEASIPLLRRISRNDGCKDSHSKVCGEAKGALYEKQLRLS